MAVSRLQTLIDESRRRQGRWLLTPNHEIVYRGDGPDELLSLKGQLVAAEPARLLFSASEKASDQKTVTRLLGLDGEWKVNAKNRIIFGVEKQSGRSNDLVFRSAWHLNDRWEIVYSYKQSVLKTRRKLERELIFSGAWHISEKNRIVFRLGADDRSRLTFRGAFQTPSILAKKGELRYQLGVEGTAGPGLRTLAFFGKWKISRDFGLSFELEGGEKKKKVLSLGAQWHLDASDTVSAELISARGDRLGASVLFSRTFWDDGQFFIRASRMPGESRAEAGVRFTR